MESNLDWDAKLALLSKPRIEMHTYRPWRDCAGSEPLFDEIIEESWADLWGSGDLYPMLALHEAMLRYFESAPSEPDHKTQKIPCVLASFRDLLGETNCEPLRELYRRELLPSLEVHCDACERDLPLISQGQWNSHCSHCFACLQHQRMHCEAPECIEVFAQVAQAALAERLFGELPESENPLLTPFGGCAVLQAGAVRFKDDEGILLGPVGLFRSLDREGLLGVCGLHETVRKQILDDMLPLWPEGQPLAESYFLVGAPRDHSFPAVLFFALRTKMPT